MALGLRQLHTLLTARAAVIPLGLTWAFVFVSNSAVLLTSIVAAAQRPASDLVASLGAIAVVIAPLLVFVTTGMKFGPIVPVLIFGAWSLAVVIFLFATTTPVSGDFAPMLLALMVAVVATLTRRLSGILAAMWAAGLLLLASRTHHLDVVALYLSCVAAAWPGGYLMQTKQQLLIDQSEILAEHGATQERQRIAREIHDVVAHSLAVTMLHLTAARRGLQVDGDIDEAVDALAQAEHLGRQGMGDIRRTVGLLGGPSGIAPPEPTVTDIAGLIDGFRQAGINVSVQTDGATSNVSPAVGLALYRITQEALANIAKHAPNTDAEVTLSIRTMVATLEIVNDWTGRNSHVAPCNDGHGLSGIRQRVELLHGAVNIGPAGKQWIVHATVPLE